MADRIPFFIYQSYQPFWTLMAIPRMQSPKRFFSAGRPKWLIAIAKSQFLRRFSTPQLWSHKPPFPTYVSRIKNKIDMIGWTSHSNHSNNVCRVRTILHYKSNLWLFRFAQEKCLNTNVTLMFIQAYRIHNWL